MKTIVAIVLLGTSIMVAATAAESGKAKRSFLMLSDQSIDFVDGAPVQGRWPVAHRWDAKMQRSIETVDGVDFVQDKQFWSMVKENTAKNSAKSQVRIETDGRLFCGGKPVEIGLGVRRLDSVLRWRDWIVAVGTSTDGTRSTIKGPIWYLFWFDVNTLKGSHLQVSTAVALPLRIYSE